MLINLDELNCEGCPAIGLQDFYINHIKKVEILRNQALQRLHGKAVCCILLCESAPANAFIYDPLSNSNLRNNLIRELIGGGNSEALYRYMGKRSIWLADCALCPLHKLSTVSDRKESDRQKAAQICLERHTLPYLQAQTNARIVTIFPKGCGISGSKLALLVRNQILRPPFQFSKLDGLKELLESICPDC